MDGLLKLIIDNYLSHDPGCSNSDPELDIDLDNNSPLPRCTGHTNWDDHLGEEKNTGYKHKLTW